MGIEEIKTILIMLGLEDPVSIFIALQLAYTWIKIIPAKDKKIKELEVKIDAWNKKMKDDFFGD